MGVSLFNLRHTFESAQPLTFHADYDADGNTLTYATGAHIINVGHYGKDDRGELVIVSKDLGFAAKEVSKRFRLSDNMERVYRKIGTDEFMRRSISNYRGMRLTINDPWETTVVFMISQFNNVKRIRLITKNIIGRFGRPIVDEEGAVIAKSFPESGDMLKATEKDFRQCGAGFRAKYLKDLAEYCTNNINLYKLDAANYDKLMEELMSIKGVGEKVADCIALMGYGNLRAFPVDVWVKRTIERAYFKGKKLKMKDIKGFAEEKWGKGDLGYAQQYVFWGGRQSGREDGTVNGHGKTERRS